MTLYRKNKLNLKECAGWLIVCGIFMERYYEMVILFLALLVINQLQKKLNFSRNILFFLLILGIYSFSCITLSNYAYNKFIQQFFLLTYFVMCYAVIFRYFRGDIPALFAKYLCIAHVVAYLGIIQFAVYYICGIDIFCWVYGRVSVEVLPGILRVSSIIDEPSYLSTILTPAFSYYLFTGLFPLNKRKLIVILAIFLTFSTITFVVVGILLFYKYVYLRNKYACYSIFIILLLLFLLGGNFKRLEQSGEETAFSAIVMKLQDTYEGFIAMDPDVFETLNMSSYATMVNVWVALNAPNRIMGTGLGTHELNYYREYKSDYIFYGLNAQDGYSLLNRLYSEFGVLGLILCLWVIYRNYNLNNIINISVFFLILTLLIRGGHYVRYGFIFWAFLYYYSGSFIYSSKK
ncbi:hypothetical protein O1443_15185 [Bacteroides fragilis]|uniref:hypothetical protein n=1 Tax=Bacteroides fragilis TaxID=817 RepID=UPI0022AA1C1B|nr:hypothetical protein [Bacteroides fragilis]MCZ2577218.1 hypothetical protein [Bacteroides fragilis]